MRTERVGTMVLALPRTGLSWPLLMAAAAFLALAGRPELLRDADTYWHIATGWWIFQHGAVPTVDVFSYTMPGSHWTAHEWLSEVLLAGSFNVAGWAGVLSLTAAAIALALAMLARFLLRHLEPVQMLIVAALSASLIAPHLLARPHILIAPIMVAWSIALSEAREQGNAPRWWLAILIALWANMHASFLVGLALAGAFAVEAVLTPPSAMLRKRAAKEWGLFLALAVAAALCTPFRLQGLLYPIQVDNMSFALSVLGEWRSPDFHAFQPLELWLLVGACVALLRGVRLPPVRVAVLLVLLHLALKHARHADLLALIAPVLIAAPFGAQRTAPAPGEQSVLDPLFASLVPRARPATVIVVIALLGAFAARLIDTNAVRPAAATTPEAALRAAHQHHVQGPVLNDYNFGGYLIFSGIQPFIDGRADLYGDDYLRQYIDAVQSTKPKRLQALLNQYGVQWTLLSPDLPAAAFLDTMPGWQRLYADDIAVVHVRTSPPSTHEFARPPRKAAASAG